MSTWTGYRQDLGVKMKRLLGTLSEKGRRRPLATEVARPAA
ncbi:hypothetical protein [Polaromonas sp. CG9_12]|nr:hypothetical protein [Polaromonas sp. CG9_12]